MMQGIFNAQLAILPSFSTQQGALLPLVFAALLVDAMIVTIWYVLGLVINNSTVKSSAIGELWQFFGNAILIGVIIFALITFSSLFHTLLSNSSLLSDSAVVSLCNNVQSAASSSGTPISLLSGESTGGNGLSYIFCNTVSGAATDPTTTSIDFPLAAAGVVLENLTLQSVVNLNSLFVIDSYVGFLSRLSPTFSICISGLTVEPLTCFFPLPPPLPPPFLVLSFSATPYAGLAMVYRGFGSLGTLLTTAIESFVIQLTLVTIFLYAWPFLLFIGLILRSTFFTRKIGGLLIAVAIGIVFFYPLIFAIQYLTLGHGLGYVPSYSPSNIIATSQNSVSSIYGFNGINTNPITALPGYNLNFYIMPSMENIANSYGCYPPLGDSTGALTAETADIAFQLVPFISVGEIVTSAYTSYASHYPTLLLPYQCSPNQAEGMLFALVNSYGVYGITAYLLPLMDIIITTAAIIGLSGILGGDISLAGLGRLV